MTRCDVLIVGAGTAGCACAIGLPSGLSALLVDRGEPARGRCCGGLVAHDAQRALADLCPDLPVAVRVQPEPEFVHALDLESGRDQLYRRNYWNIDRERFDSWLLGLALARAELRSGTRFVSAEPSGSGFRIRLARCRQEEAVWCRFLVGADGARSNVRRRFFPDRPAVPASIAIQACLPACATLEHHEVIFSRRLTDFYAWAIPKPDCVLIGSAFSDFGTAKPRFEEVVSVMCRRNGIRPEVLSRSSRPISRPGREAELFPGRSRVLLAGEAAGLVSPSSGEGISYALRSGNAAGRALAGRNPPASYRREFVPLARAVCRKFLKARVIFSPRLRRLALRLPFYP